MADGEMFASRICRAINAIANGNDDRSIEFLYKVCFSKIEKKAKDLSPRLLIEYGKDDLCLEFFKYLLSTPNVIPNLQRVCHETRYGLAKYLDTTIYHFIGLMKRNVSVDSTKQKEASSMKHFLMGNPEITTGEEIVDSEEAVPKLESESRFPKILEIILSLNNKKQRAFLNRFYISKSDPKNKYLEDVSDDYRYQLVHRMRKDLNTKLARENITAQDFRLFLQSDYMSDLERRVTSCKQKDQI
jgi:hypothetical protein